MAASSHIPSDIAAGFLAAAEQRPNAPALVWHGDTIGYAELAERAAKAGARIEQLDLDAGEPLAVLAQKSPEAIALVLACLQLGRACLLPSPSLADATLAAVLDRAGCRHVLSPDPSPGDPTPASTPGSGAVPASTPVSAPVDGGTALLLATSGSTGVPKVVPLSHGAIDRFTLWASRQFGIGPGTTVLNYAPLNFDLCLLDVWATLRCGGTVVLVDPDRGTDGAHLRDLIAGNRVAVVQAVPMVYRLLVDAGAGGPAGAEGLATVEHVIVTGDAIAARTLAELPRLFPRARISNVYGCTETNDSLLHEVDGADLAAAMARAEPLPLGRPIAGVEAVIVGPEGEVVTGPGTGELHVTTPFQTGGYLDPELNAVKFVTRGGRRWFRSGDLVRLTPGGRIVLEGRNDFQVKVRGVAVNTAEVERVLLDHPRVAEAAVVAVADAVAGKRLHATVRRAGEARLNSLVVRQHLAERLVPAAVPSTVHIVDEPLPTTSTGKVDRQSVARSLAGATQPHPMKRQGE